MTAATVTDQRFLKHLHIRQPADFQRAYAGKQRAGDDVLLVFACRNGLAHPRLGLSVSRKAGNAVVRNRWKRVIREAFRLARERLPAGLDLVVIPRREAAAELKPVQASLERLAGKLARRLERSGR